MPGATGHSAYHSNVTPFGPGRVNWLQVCLALKERGHGGLRAAGTARGGRWLGADAGRGSSSHLFPPRRRAEGHARPWLGYVGRGSPLSTGDRGVRKHGRREESGWRQLCSAPMVPRSCNGRLAAAVEGGTGPFASPSVTVTTVTMTTRDARAPEDLAVAMVPRRGLRSLFYDGAFLFTPPAPASYFPDSFVTILLSMFYLILPWT